MALAAPAWAGLDEGVAAYERRDYATALREWRPFAEQGDDSAGAVVRIGPKLTLAAPKCAMAQ